MADMQSNETSQFVRKLVVPTIAGAISGIVAVAVVMAVMDGMVGEDISPSRMIAAAIGALYIVIAIGVAVGAASPALGEKYLNAEDAEELRDQRGLLLNSALAMACWGALPLVLAFAGPNGPLSEAIAAVLAIALAGIGTWFGWKSYELSDELMSAVNLEGSMIALLLVFVVLTAWGGAAHLGFLPAAGPLDVISAFYFLSLIASFIPVARRGMLKLK